MNEDIDVLIFGLHRYKTTYILHKDTHKGDKARKYFMDLYEVMERHSFAIPEDLKEFYEMIQDDCQRREQMGR